MLEKSIKGLNLAIGVVIIAMLTSAVTAYKFKETNPKTGMSTASAEQVQKDLKCLALNIYREAGNEPFEGKVAVAQVTINRTQNPDFPNEICDVVYQKNNFTGRIVCQFSWYCDSTHRNRPINKELYDESYRVAKMVLLEDFRLESLDQALYYHADYVNPNWGFKKITKIGQHIFYKGKKVSS
jgi:spore germination cell wall hydrolase CwlJ-like protein